MGGTEEEVEGGGGEDSAEGERQEVGARGVAVSLKGIAVALDDELFCFRFFRGLVLVCTPRGWKICDTDSYS